MLDHFKKFPIHIDYEAYINTDDGRRLLAINKTSIGTGYYSETEDVDVDLTYTSNSTLGICIPS